MKQTNESLRHLTIEETYELSDAILKNQSDEIKKELIDKLLYELWNRNCIEFTKQEDHLTGTHLFRARIYALPDDQVRIVRQNNVV